MPQDAFTLKFLCKELKNVLNGGKVNRIVQSDNDRVIFTIFTGTKTEKFLISVNPSSPRIGLIKEDEDSPLSAPNFCMLLRKHLLSSTIRDISIVGFDRIVKMDFETSAEFCDSKLITLYIELMGRYSNIIITDNGKVLGCNRGINMFDDGVRPLIVGRDYVFPPTNGKLNPNDRQLIEIFDAIDRIDENFICNNVQGLALSTAKEIINGFDFNSQKMGERLFNRLNDYINNCKINACVLEEDKKVKDVFVYPYLDTNKNNLTYFNSLYLAEDYYFEKKEKEKILSQGKNRLLSIVNSSIKKSNKRLYSILQKEKEASNLEENRIKGELIVANIYRINRGEEKVSLPNYYDNGNIVEIALDSRLSPSDNAQVYYKKYNKQKRTLSAIIPQKEETQKEIDYLQSVYEEIEIADSIEQVSCIKKELEEIGLIAIQNTKKKVHKEVCQYNRYEYCGYTIKVGRNNIENDHVTFSSNSEDVWLHVKDYHSSHAIIEAVGKEVPEKVILFTAEIVAYYSKAREENNVEVVFTPKKFVKKPPKSRLGFVTYTNYKTILVSGNKHAEFLKTN